MKVCTPAEQPVMLPRADSEEPAEIQKSIKDILLSHSNFDFSNVSQESNQTVISRVEKYCKDFPNLIEHLPDGSIYYGQKHSGQPNGCGFVAVFAPNSSGQKKIEQIYLGHFLKGKAETFGYLIFDQGLGRYTGEWKEGKYHGQGLFTR